MEITWLGLLLLLVAWASAGVSTGFGFYLYTKDKDYDMSTRDKGFLLTAGVTAACALAFTTIVTFMVIFSGNKQFSRHAVTINNLMKEKLELENKLNSIPDQMEDSQSMRTSSRRQNILENPIPVMRGRSARPLIV